MMMPGRKFSAQGGYRLGFNGQEKDSEIYGEGNSYGALYWEYDSRIGRRWNVDPKPNESMSPYLAFANNPIWLSDHLGDTIIVKGDDEFKKNTQQNLLKIYQTDYGKKVIDKLNSSNQNYTIEEVLLVKNSEYNSNSKTVFYDDNPWRKTLDGGAINGTIALAHEIFHAYQDDLGNAPSIHKVSAETQATYFQNYITSVFSYGNMRTSYSGIGHDIFPDNERSYNPKNEKIANLKITRFINRAMTNEIVLGNSKSDNTTVRIKVRAPIDLTYSLMYEKRYTVDGKVIKQSIKKENEKALSKQ